MFGDDSIRMLTIIKVQSGMLQLSRVFIMILRWTLMLPIRFGMERPLDPKNSEKKSIFHL